MLTRVQKEDLRFVRDCLGAGGEAASTALVLALIELNPVLEQLLPNSKPARATFLEQACRLVGEAVEGPGRSRERLRFFGRRCAPALFTPQSVQGGADRLHGVLQAHLGPTYTPRVKESCEAALVAAVGFLQDGVSDQAVGGANGAGS